MKKIILPLLVILTLIVGCVKKDKGPGSPPTVPITELSFDNDNNSKLMFQDGEPVAVFTAQARSYEIGKVLRVKAVTDTTIEVANFAPVDIVDATILLTIDGSSKPIKLFNIKKIRANGVQEIKYPFINGTSKFVDVDNATVDLSQYKTTGLAVNRANFDFTGVTDLIIKLKKLAKLKWKVRYTDYDPNHDPTNNWKNYIDARDIRRFSGFIINLAYLIQADTTRIAYVAEPIIDNDGVTFLTTTQKDAAFQKMIDIPLFSCGVVDTVNGTDGLGGGSVFGVADYVLHDDYLTKDICFIAIHEVGHMIGYNHSSSMTYPKNGQGAVVACGRVYKQMLLNDEFPIKKANYYKQSDL